MGWYVFALVDAPPASRPGKGLSGSLGLRRIGRAYAVVERRADVPPAEFGTLQRHHEIVRELAEQVPAILPVRFGTLLDTDALEEALTERDDDIEDAFAVVRGRVQFTWRRGSKGSKGSEGSRGSRGSHGSRGSKGSRGSEGSGGSKGSGTAYLLEAARAARPVPPAGWRSLRSKLAPLVVGERYQPAQATMPDSLYHLVARDSAIRYATLGRALAHADPALAMTGPWPPFAFAADTL